MKTYNVLVNYETGEILAAGKKNIAARMKIEKGIYEDIYTELSKKEIKERLDDDFVIGKVDYDTFKSIRNGEKTVL